jgi:sec-independent protein translocase protein TatA
MPHFSAATIILLIVVALLLFGPSKLPELGRAFGKTLKEFKNGAKDIMGDDESNLQPRKEIQVEEIKIHEIKTKD